MSAALVLPLGWPRGAARAEEGEEQIASRQSGVAVPISSLAFYRRYTELLLRRYMAVSMHMGRVSSILGSCAFRGRVSSYKIRSFDDAVIFVYDVEKCLKVLSEEQAELIERIALQEYTQAEAAELTRQSLRTVVRKYGEAVDRLTQVFLEKDLLEVGPAYSGREEASDEVDEEDDEEFGEEVCAEEEDNFGDYV